MLRALADRIRRSPRLVIGLLLATGVPVVVVTAVLWSGRGADRHGQRPPGPGRSGVSGPGEPGTVTQPGSPVGSSGAGPSVSGSRPSGGVWRPGPSTTWQWQIVDTVASPFRDVVMYDVDLTDAVPRSTVVPVPGFGSVTWPAGENAGVVERLHAAGKVVVCYLDTGAWEKYEPDARLFPGTPGWRSTDASTDVIGKTTGWDNEYWLDIRPAQWPRFAAILWARFDLARSIGCDGVEPDQNNPYENDPGPPISLADEKAWYLEVARQAHARGLSVGMKNGVEVTDAQTVAAFDWNLNEQCFFYNECHILDAFIRAGKAVFQTEYTDDWDGRGFAEPAALAKSPSVCADARRHRFATLIKKQVPDSSYVAC